MDIQDNRLTKNLSKTLLFRNKMNAKKFIKNLKIKMLLNSSITEKYIFTKSTFNQQYQINNNKRSAAICSNQIREPPKIAKSYS